MAPSCARVDFIDTFARCVSLAQMRHSARDAGRKSMISNPDVYMPPEKCVTYYARALMRKIYRFSMYIATIRMMVKPGTGAYQIRQLHCNEPERSSRSSQKQSTKISVQCYDRLYFSIFFG